MLHMFHLVFNGTVSKSCLRFFFQMKILKLFYIVTYVITKEHQND